jgi:hypothetical protein
VREWTLTLPRELPLWELESRWIPEFSKSNYRDQNSIDWVVIYIIGKLLERRFLKWTYMTHLNIWNTSYGQKKGQESNWQFDSWPLKVENHLDFLACRWRMTYRWKSLDKGYNFALDLISMGPQSRGSPRSENFGTPIWESQDKMPFGWGGLVKRHKIYYKGEGGGFPQVRAVVSFVSLSLPVTRLNIKSVSTMH